MRIREAGEEDFEQIWLIFHEVVSRGDTYAFDPATDREEAYRLWMQLPAATYVAVDGERVLGTYYIKPNAAGPAAHVCNAGYMVAAAARGRHVGRAMGEHSLGQARSLGFRAMQFNMVVSTNIYAIRLWRALGFREIGRIPAAFRHPEQGFVDALILYRTLDNAAGPS